MAAREKQLNQGKRIEWLDNLRTITIFLVVLYHIGGVYESAGLWGWFWIVDDPDTISWVGIAGILFDIMVMPIMFFVSGYLTPASLKNRTGWDFLKGKFKRLMVPWVIAVFTLIPVYKVIFLYSRDLPQENWNTYFHITNPNSQNWLWFLPVLFLFDMLYLMLSKANIKLQSIPLKGAIAGVFLIGFAYSFIIGGMLGFRSWTLTPWIDFENERLLVYFMAFLLGALCHQQNIFAEPPKNTTLYAIASSVAWIPVTVHIIARLFPIFNSEDFTISPLYRAVWWISFDFSLLCLMYIMIETFRRYLNKTSKVWTGLNRNSYGVYIIHVIVIGIFGTLLLNMQVPALAKYPTLIILTYLASNLVVSGYRNLIHFLRSVNGTPRLQSAD